MSTAKNVLLLSPSHLIFNLSDTDHSTMNVGQLRKYLEQYAEDTEIYIDIDNGYGFSQLSEKQFELSSK